MSGRLKLHKIKARRRVSVRSALLLTLGVCFFMGNYRLFASLNGAVGLLGDQALLGLMIETLFSVVIFGGASYLGLYVLDGDQTKVIPRGSLSRAQILWLALAGMALTAPVSLADNVLYDVFGWGMKLPQRMSPYLTAGMLLRMLKSALVVPVLEELFFRGYLEGALERYGKGRAAIVSALCFAAVHMGGKGGTPHQWIYYAAIGLLFSAVRMKTGSMLAPMLMHGCYNLSLMLFSFMGFSDWFSRLSFVSCTVRLAMFVGFMFCLRRAWTARGTREKLHPMERLTKKEKALVAAALIAALCVALFTA